MGPSPCSGDCEGFDLRRGLALGTLLLWFSGRGFGDCVGLAGFRDLAGRYLDQGGGGSRHLARLLAWLEDAADCSETYNRQHDEPQYPKDDRCPARLLGLGLERRLQRDRVRADQLMTSIQATQIGFHLVHRPVALFRLFFEGSHDDALELLGKLRNPHPRGDRVLVHLLGEDAHHRVGVVRHVPGDHLVEKHPERVDVRPLVDLLACALLGRHVVWGAENLAVPRESVRAIGHLGDSEIEYLDEVLVVAPANQKNVLRLEVAVHDARVMGCAECQTDLAGDVYRSAFGETLHGVDGVDEVEALEALHHKIGRTVGERTEVVDVDDVFVADVGRAFSFAPEPREHFLVSDVLASEHFDREGLVEPRVGRSVNQAHPAFAEQSFNAVAVVDERADQGVGRSRDTRVSTAVLRVVADPSRATGHTVSQQTSNLYWNTEGRRQQAENGRVRRFRWRSRAWAAASRAPGSCGSGQETKSRPSSSQIVMDPG